MKFILQIMACLFVPFVIAAIANPKMLTPPPEPPQLPAVHWTQGENKCAAKFGRGGDLYANCVAKTPEFKAEIQKALELINGK